MDTATQALLGAVVGQAAYSHRLGRRAVAWGAVGGLLPDLDVLAVATHGPFGEFLYHRGFTHALWFGPVVGPALGWLVWRAYARRRGKAHRVPPPGRLDPGDPTQLSAWIGLFTLALFTHPLIDVFTAYGTQLLAPFSLERFAINSVGIIDPTYSGILIAALLAGWGLRRNTRRARLVATVALALSWGYLGYGWLLNEQARADVTARLQAQGVTPQRVNVYPTLLQPYLRRVVVRADGEIWVGLYSPFRAEGPVWERFRPEPAEPWLDKLLATREGAIFAWFAMGEVAARVQHEGGSVTVELDDLRYGVPGIPERGLWGIRGVFDRTGRLLGPVRRIGMARPSIPLGALWRATWGDFSGLVATRPSRF